MASAINLTDAIYSPLTSSLASAKISSIFILGLSHASSETFQSEYQDLLHQIRILGKNQLRQSFHLKARDFAFNFVFL